MRFFNSTALASRFICCALALAATQVRAQDWPQWMGPNRDNDWHASGVVDKFPETGAKILWKTPIANGYSGPAVAAGRVFVTQFHSDANIDVSNFERAAMSGTESVICMDANTGKEVWKQEFPVTYAISYPNGPRATPLVDGKLLYTLGAEGRLNCFEAATGQSVWTKELKQLYNTKTPLWGFAAHPMIDGNKLICVAGGEGSHTIALNKLTGEEIWRYGTASEQGYCPVRIVNLAGQRQMLILSPDWLAAVDPESGKEIWKHPYKADNGCIIMTPLVVQDKYVFVGGFNKRNLLLELTGSQPTIKPLAQDRPKELISPANVQPYVVDNILYGVDADGTMMAVELPSGKRLWETGQPMAQRPVRSGTAFIVRGGEHFWLFTENGELVICDLTPAGYKEIDRTKILEPTSQAAGRPVVWSAPAFADTRMYARSDKELVCVELKK